MVDYDRGGHIDAAGDTEEILSLAASLHEIVEIPANGSTEVNLDFLPRRVGMLKLPRLELLDSGSQTALSTLETPVFVQA